MLSHNSLANYYKTVFALTQHHKYQISEVENILPYERDLYVDLLLEHLEEQKQRAEQQRRG